MNIYTLLKKDHRKVSDLFKKLTSVRTDERRQALLDVIHDELMLHAKTEEATFYAALEVTAGKRLEELMPEAEHAHDELRGLFSKIRSAKVGSPRWYMLIGSLKHAVEHHVEEEEGIIFKHAKEVLTREQEEALAQQMKMLKKQEAPSEERIHEAPAQAA